MRLHQGFGVTRRSLSVAMAVCLALVGLPAAGAQAQDDELQAQARKIVSQMKQLGLSEIAVVGVEQALDDPLLKAVLKQLPQENLKAVTKQIDLGSAEELTKQMETLQGSSVGAVMPVGDAGVVQAVMQQMRDLALKPPALVMERDETGEERLVKKGVMPVFSTVLDVQRPESTDLLYLKNGDKLTGQVVSPSFSIRTSYAQQLQFDTRLIAGILFEGEAYMETLFTVNQNKFSGFIDDPAVRFKLAQGAEIAVRKEKISKIVFHTRENELGGIPRNNVITLNNLDVMTGQVLNQKFNMKTTYATIPVDIATVEHMAMIGGQNVLTTLRLKGSDDQVQGILEDEDIEVDLDCGPTVKIYQDRIRDIQFQKGYAGGFDLSSLAVGGLAMRGGMAGRKELVNSVGMKLILMPVGEFKMGSNDGAANEKPVHAVRITKPFYLGGTEVTQAEWEAVMGANPSNFKGAKRPVEQVSWDDCQEFCRRLTERDRKANKIPKGATYGLPTEAEWEYACRAGSATKYCYGDAENTLGEYAWYEANSGKTTHDAAQRKPNAWGLYDMHGNVWEWCQDWYGENYYGQSLGQDPAGPANGQYRVLRGGAWLYDPACCRSAIRTGYSPADRYFYFGLRVVLRDF